MARSYEQHCGLAAALDVTTRRWTLLIVRDLEPGPRRFNQLFAGLPGISTDLLADRLRDLQAAGAVTHETDGDQAQVYALTERGQELAIICHDLARWGMPLLPALETTPYRTSVRWALQTMAANAATDLDPTSVGFEFADHEPLTLQLGVGGGQLRYGADGEADVTVTLDAGRLLELRAWADGADDQLPSGMSATGATEQLRSALRQLHLRRPH